MRKAYLVVAVLCFVGCGLSGVPPLGGGSTTSGGNSNNPVPSPQPTGNSNSPSSSGNGNDNGGANTGNGVPGNPYTFIGRFDFSNPNAPVMALLQSKIGAAFTGKTLSVTLSDTGDDFYNVRIDGNAPIVIEANSRTPTTIPISNDLPTGTHTVWMTKRTEFAQSNAAGTDAVGQTTFYGFVLEQGGAFLAAPPAAKHRIEFLGDSGFTGYGVDLLDQNHSTSSCFEPAQEDGDKSVPGYTASILGADAINASWSGEGVLLSVWDPNPAHQLPVNYTDTLPPAQSPVWDFSRWQADVVVISAGGDDLQGNAGAGFFSDPNAWQTAYVNWLVQIRSKYPHALIVNVLTAAAASGDITTLGGALQQATATRNAAGDANVVYFNYYAGTPYTTYDDAEPALKLYWGCAGHPSPAGAQWLGNQLATFIKTKTGW